MCNEMLTDEMVPGIYCKDDPVQWEKVDTDETEELAMLVLPGMWVQAAVLSWCVF